MRRQTSLVQSPCKRGTAGGSLTNRRCGAHPRWLFSRRSRPSQLFLRQNGPQPSRARLFLARRSGPLTARTGLASAVSRRAALVGKQPFPLVSFELFLTPLSRPPFRPPGACAAGTAGRICPPPTDTPPASAPPPGLPGCDSPAPPPARVPPPIADSTARQFRRLDQHGLQMRVALLRDRSPLLLVGRRDQRRGQPAVAHGMRHRREPLRVAYLQN